MAKGYKGNRNYVAPTNVVIAQPVVTVVDGMPTIAPVEVNAKVCPGCKKPISEYGQCPHGCGYLSRSSAGRENRVEGDKYKNLDTLQDWSFSPLTKQTEQIKPVQFQDEIDGFSLLYSQFRLLIAIPSEVAYWEEFGTGWEAANDKGEYVEMKVKLDTFEGSAEAVGIDALTAKLLKMVGGKAALAALLAQGNEGPSNVVANVAAQLEAVGS